MSHLEENARLSHELEEARDTIEAMASQVRELRQEFDLVVAQNLELRSENKKLQIEVMAWRRRKEMS